MISQLKFVKEVCKNKFATASNTLSNSLLMHQAPVTYKLFRLK